MIVSKRHERLCRALAMENLWNIGFPTEHIMDRVDESWPGYLSESKSLIKLINSIADVELDGQTTKAAIERWSKE